MSLKCCIESLPHARQAASTALFLFDGRGKATARYLISSPPIWKGQNYWLVFKLQLAVHYTLQFLFTLQYYSNDLFMIVFPTPCKNIYYAIPKVK